MRENQRQHNRRQGQPLPPHENFRKDGSSAQYTTTLRNGVVVEVTGTRMNLDEVKAASSLLDLATLEKLQRRTLP